MSWIMDKIKGMFAGKYVRSTVRTLLVALGGVLAGLGLADEDVQRFVEAAEPVVTGLVAVGLAWFWSLADKQKNQD